MSTQRLKLAIAGTMFYLVASSNIVWGQNRCVTEDEQRTMLEQYCKNINGMDGHWSVGSIYAVAKIGSPVYPDPSVPDGYSAQIADDACQFWVFTDCDGNIVSRSETSCYSGG